MCIKVRNIRVCPLCLRRLRKLETIMKLCSGLRHFHACPDGKTDFITMAGPAVCTASCCCSTPKLTREQATPCSLCQEYQQTIPEPSTGAARPLKTFVAWPLWGDSLSVGLEINSGRCYRAEANQIARCQAHYCTEMILDKDHLYPCLTRLLWHNRHLCVRTGLPHVRSHSISTLPATMLRTATIEMAYLTPTIVNLRHVLGEMKASSLEHAIFSASQYPLPVLLPGCRRS